MEQLRDQQVFVDGFNLIITVEAALCGAPLFVGIDECIRDLSSVHGSYRSVDETEPAIFLTGETLHNPDRAIVSSRRIAITSDSSILDQVESWADLKTYLIANEIPDAWMVDLRTPIAVDYGAR